MKTGMKHSEEMRKSRLFFGIMGIVLFVILSVNTCYATAENRSTSQQWTFTSSPGQPNADGFYGPFSPAAGWDNEFGEPQLYAGGRALWGNNAWALRNDEIDIYIPNFQTPNPYKIMEVELTWMQGTAAVIPALPKEPIICTFPYGQILSREDRQKEINDWISTKFTIRIEPNPSAEWLIIKGNISLLNVSVDTVCIPEPATIGLFIGGAVLAIKRSRNRYENKRMNGGN